MVTPEERRSNQRDNQEFFSEKLSDVCRYIGFGLIAASFTLLTKGDKQGLKLEAWADFSLMTVALIGCGVIFLDISQLHNGWLNAKDAATNEDGEYKNTPAGLEYKKANLRYFTWKRYAALAGSALLVITLLFNFPSLSKKTETSNSAKTESIC